MVSASSCVNMPTFAKALAYAWLPCSTKARLCYKGSSSVSTQELARRIQGDCTH
jgi:hypothetical protein